MTNADLILEAAADLGWKVVNGIVVKPCIKNANDLIDHCYTHDEKLHCECCCDNTLFRPVIRKMKHERGNP